MPNNNQAYNPNQGYPNYPNNQGNNGGNYPYQGGRGY
jgi:hypothetical protein